MRLDQFVIRALSVPYIPAGRTWEGWDCWGLVYIAYRELFGIEISKLSGEYDAETSFAELNAVIDIQKLLWSETDRPEYGDVSLFKISRFQTHVSLVLPKGQMIHCLQSVGTAVERTDVIHWAKRHAGYYRHEKRRFGSGGAASPQD